MIKIGCTDGHTQLPNKGMDQLDMRQWFCKDPKFIVNRFEVEVVGKETTSHLNNIILRSI